MAAQLKLALPVEAETSPVADNGRNTLTIVPRRPAGVAMPAAELEPRLADLFALAPARWIEAAAYFAGVVAIVAGLVKILWSL